MVREESLTETEEAILGSSGALQESQPGLCRAPEAVAVSSRTCHPPERTYQWLSWVSVWLSVLPHPF